MPTAYEPVKVSPSTPGWRTTAAPTSSPPGRYWNAPAGTPASIRHSYSLAPVKEPCGDGLNSTVLPATSAAPEGPAASAIGKLNGLITAQTP